jgi:hypothetical protein
MSARPTTGCRGFRIWSFNTAICSIFLSICSRASRFSVSIPIACTAKARSSPGAFIDVISGSGTSACGYRERAGIPFTRHNQDSVRGVRRSSVKSRSPAEALVQHFATGVPFASRRGYDTKRQNCTDQGTRISQSPSSGLPEGGITYRICLSTTTRHGKSILSRIFKEKR